MRLLDSGLIHEFLSLLGIEIVTASGTMLAFVVCAALLSVCVISLLVLIFKFLVYLRRG